MLVTVEIEMHRLSNKTITIPGRRIRGEITVYHSSHSTSSPKRDIKRGNKGSRCHIAAREIQLVHT